ncbi:retrovirus-related Pol polyprotein from transposon 17.6 [Trichonephila clavipes]|nr:retrovirus-related Pol polyprotein from transposon 17.6 [Trichonephila clavipes]
MRSTTSVHRTLLHPTVTYPHYSCWDGIEADQEKISAIQKIPVPTNVKEVQSLLQACSWFRRYVPNFADIARPLSSLTKKKALWHWGPEQQESFKTLKMRLMTSPIMKQADGSKPFTIRTDASNYALGAVLLQGSDPNEHVTDYASHLMVPAERNYSTTEREVLAVVRALEKLRGYLENQQIFLASDHQPLKWLLSIKSLSGRLARWAWKIQSFNLKIDYTPGKANVVAGMLSRPSYTEGAASDMCAITVVMPSRKSSDIQKGQLEDEEQENY